MSQDRTTPLPPADLSMIKQVFVHYPASRAWHEFKTVIEITLMAVASVHAETDQVRSARTSFCKLSVHGG